MKSLRLQFEDKIKDKMVEKQDNVIKKQQKMYKRGIN